MVVDVSFRETLSDDFLLLRITETVQTPSNAIHHCSIQHSVSKVRLKNPPSTLVVAIAGKLEGIGENQRYHVKVEQFL